MQSNSRLPRWPVIAGIILLSFFAGGCRRAPGDSAATLPAQAVQQLVDDLGRHDLAAYARHAVPEDVHQRLELAWREGRSLWPLTELPLDAKFQEFLIVLAAPGSEQALLAGYQHQFAGANAEIRNAAATLGLFATQFVAKEPSYGAAERDHYVQLIRALSRWGQRAPLSDPEHARRAVPQLALAARATGLGVPDGLRQTGMERSLERLGPFFARLEQVTADYGLDFGAAAHGLTVTLAEQNGDHARVRLRYTLAGEPIDAQVLLERRDGRWYLSDLLRRAEQYAGPPPPRKT